MMKETSRSRHSAMLSAGALIVLLTGVAAVPRALLAQSSSYTFQ